MTLIRYGRNARGRSVIVGTHPHPQNRRVLLSRNRRSGAASVQPRTSDFIGIEPTFFNTWGGNVLATPITPIGPFAAGTTARFQMGVQVIDNAQQQASLIGFGASNAEWRIVTTAGGGPFVRLTGAITRDFNFPAGVNDDDRLEIQIDAVALGATTADITVTINGLASPSGTQQVERTNWDVSNLGGAGPLAPNGAVTTFYHFQMQRDPVGLDRITDRFFIDEGPGNAVSFNVEGNNSIDPALGENEGWTWVDDTPSPPPDVNPTLVIQYRFSESLGPQSIGGRGPTLTEINGPLTYDADGVTLNGSGQYLEALSVPGYNRDEGAIFVTFRFVDITNPVQQWIVEYSDTSAERNQFYHRDDLPRTNFEGNSGGTGQWNRAQILDPGWLNGELHRLAGWWKVGAGAEFGAEYYVDGVRVGSGDTNVAAGPLPAILRIGDSVAFTPRWFNGSIDEHALFDVNDGGIGDGSRASANDFARELSSGARLPEDPTAGPILNPTLAAIYDFGITQSPAPKYGSYGPTLAEIGTPTYNSTGVVLNGVDQNLQEASDFTWFNEASGIFGVEIIADNVAIGRDMVALEIGSASNNRITLFWAVARSNCSVQISAAGQFIVADNGPAWGNGEVHRIAWHWGVGNTKVAFDGRLLDAGAAITIAAPTLFNIGNSDYFSPREWSGTVARAEHYNAGDAGTGDADQFILDWSNGLIVP